VIGRAEGSIIAWLRGLLRIVLFLEGVFKELICYLYACAIGSVYSSLISMNSLLRSTAGMIFPLARINQGN